MTTFRKTKTTILGILCAAVLMGLTGCGKNANETSVSALNTVIKISAYGSNARKGISDASDIINALNTQLDTSNESSSISRVNAAEGKEIVVPGQFIDMYNAAKTAYTMTDGEFDITVYPFVEVWGFNSGNYHNPSNEELEALRETVNFNGIMTNYYSDSGSYTMILPKKTKITFDGVSRGCATDCAIKQLKADGVDNAIISMPGTVQTMGSKPDGSPWTIAVGDPDDTTKYLGSLQLGEAAMSTTRAIDNSFTYEDGTTYTHILSPTTGEPAATNLKEVCIISDDALLADCLSTGLYAMGRNSAVRCWRANRNFEMILVTEENEILCTSGLTEQFDLSASGYKLSYIE